jgi:hypothetical protein
MTTQANSNEGVFQHMVLGATMGTALGVALSYMVGKTGPGPKLGAMAGALLGGGVAYGTFRGPASAQGTPSPEELALRRAREVYEDAAHRANLAVDRASATEEALLRRGARRTAPAPQVAPQARGFEEEMPVDHVTDAHFGHPEPMEYSPPPRALPNYRNGFVESDDRDRTLVYDSRANVYASR